MLFAGAFATALVDVLALLALDAALELELVLVLVELLVGVLDGTAVDSLVVELVPDVDVVPVVEEDAWLAVALTPATSPTVATPATAAAVQPAALVRRRRRSGSGLRGCCSFMTATMRFPASGPHHGNVKTVLRPPGNWLAQGSATRRAGLAAVRGGAGAG